LFARPAGYFILAGWYGMEGVVRKLVIDRGFGFIRCDEGGDVFFHFRDLVGGLEWDERLEARRVQFEMKPNGDKFRAVRIHPSV
jgi:cold shock CspA family protein